MEGAVAVAESVNPPDKVTLSVAAGLQRHLRAYRLGLQLKRFGHKVVRPNLAAFGARDLAGLKLGIVLA